ncbi:MAG: helix-turn-helix transcriptional regulator [Sphingobacteriaceae bacterium]|nr:helix-turn-helix transcriptional regulator [Cytophagaceae bacterium]
MRIKNSLEIYSHAEMLDQHVGPAGSPEREAYEFELNLELLGDMIKTARQERNLTQEQLGQLVGVQKAQISKLERSARNVTIETVLKVFTALKAKVAFKVEFLDQEVRLS